MDICENHGDKPIASFCRKHEVALCIECLLQDHKDCINDIEEIAVVKETVLEEAKALVEKYEKLSEGASTAFYRIQHEQAYQVLRFCCIFN